MGLFDIEETRECQLGKCWSCRKIMIGKVGIKSGELKSVPGVNLRDGIFMCEECIQSKGLFVSDIEGKTKSELLDIFKEKGFVSPEDFTPIRRVHRVGAPLTTRSNYVYLELDNERKILNVPFYEQGIINDKIRDCIISCHDIIDFNVIDNGVVISNLESLARINNDHNIPTHGEIPAELLVELYNDAKYFNERPMEGICNSLSLQIVTKGKNVCIDFIGKGLDYEKLDRSHDNKYRTISRAVRECLDIIIEVLKDKLEAKKIEVKETEEKKKSEEMIEVETKQCPNCKTQYNNNVKFCPSCGALLLGNENIDVAAPRSVANISAPKSAEMHEWVLKSTFGGSGTKVTEIKTLGSKISIDQYKMYIIKWGHQKDEFDVKDIVRLERTKKISINSIIFLLFGIACIMIHPLVAAFVILINLWTLREKIIVIHHQNGHIKIPDDRVYNGDIVEIVSFVKKYNPSAVKTFIE